MHSHSPSDLCNRRTSDHRTSHLCIDHPVDCRPSLPNHCPSLQQRHHLQRCHCCTSRHWRFHRRVLLHQLSHRHLHWCRQPGLRRLWCWSRCRLRSRCLRFVSDLNLVRRSSTCGEGGVQEKRRSCLFRLGPAYLLSAQGQSVMSSLEPHKASFRIKGIGHRLHLSLPFAIMDWPRPHKLRDLLLHFARRWFLRICCQSSRKVL